MSISCVLPELGENIETGTVVEVLVAVGDTIAVDQPILVLETDKAEFELPSPVAGTIEAVMVEAGDDVRVGQALLTIADGAAGTSAGPAPERPAEAPTAPVPTPLPAAPPTAEVEAALEPPPAAPMTEPAGTDSGRPLAAAPSVRRIARELGVDLHRVVGTGAHGRISEEDVRQYTREVLNETIASEPRAPGAGALPDFSKWGPVERVAMSKVRLHTAQNLTDAWSAPHVTQMDKADVTALEAFRKKHAPRAEAAGAKLTVTAMLTKVIAAALKQFPQFNASVDLARKEIVYKGYVHVGIAVDTERGLLVPVVRDVDRKSILTLATEIHELAEKARNRNIAPDLMQGATFTITNLGGIGGTAFTPIVNAPEVAVLGVSRAVMEPVFRDGTIEPRLQLPLALSYDHRLIDGADAARFLRWVCQVLEGPWVMLLDSP